jgi:hypothetical protein
MENLKIKVNEGIFYPIIIQDENFKKLLAIQTQPEVKYWFKDREVSIEELIEILKKVE